MRLNFDFLIMLFLLVVIAGCKLQENKCGDGFCELGSDYRETSETCSVDCKVCDDGDACTEDSFSYESQECIAEIITPCCGNDKCEIGENFNCKSDCPGGKSGFEVIDIVEYELNPDGSLNFQLVNMGENPVSVKYMSSDAGTYSPGAFNLMPGTTSDPMRWISFYSGSTDNYYATLEINYEDLITFEEVTQIGTVSSVE